MAGFRGNSWRNWLQWSCLASATAIIATVLLWPMLARASNPAHLCEAAARTAAQRHNIPLDVMRAIALVETGRSRNGQMEPWPWAINTGGPGYWPETRSAALDLVRSRLAQGRRNVDLGCFQVNYRWHGQNFNSLEEMIDPQINADYAARLLNEHRARLGTWEAAAGAYHSGTPALAQRYIARFRALRGRAPASELPQSTFAAAPRTESPRENRYSLLQPGGTQRMGSLVPTGNSASARPLISMDMVAR